MAGGTWTTQNKVRPGAYVNVKSQSLSSIAVNERGVVAMPIIADWGPEDEVVEVTALTDIYKLFGSNYTNKNLEPIALALGSSNRVLTYRLNQAGDKAKNDEGTEFKVKAKHSGTNGDKISLTVNPSNLDEDEFELKVIYDGSIVENFYFKDYGELKNFTSKYVELSEVKAGKPSAPKTVKLSGGTSGTISAGNFQKFLQKIDDLEFNVLTLGTIDEENQETFNGFYGLAAAYMKRRRDEYGNKSTMVVYQYPGQPDAEYIISIWNPVKGTDGEVMTPLATSAWFAGATAGASPNESLTYRVMTPGLEALAPDEDTPLTNENIVEALQKGLLVFSNKRGEVIVEQDLNTLHTFTTEKNQEFRKNRVVRVLDFIANDSKKSFEDNFIGQVTNNIEGRELFKSDRVRAFNLLQNDGAIQDFNPEDITISQGEQKDSVLMEAWVKPTDAMEKLYMSVVVF